MQQVPQRAGGVRLSVQHSHLLCAQIESRHVRTSLPHQLHTVIVSFGLRHRRGIQPEIRTGRRVACNLHARVVFVTKYRRGVFTDPMPARCEELMREVRADFEVDDGPGTRPERRCRLGRRRRCPGVRRVSPRREVRGGAVRQDRAAARDPAHRRRPGDRPGRPGHRG
ncbi:transposase [Streptosporangium sp. NPDC002607]